METLLIKVKALEEEARERLGEVEAAGRKRIDNLVENEQQVMAAIRWEAEKKGTSIEGEAVKKAKNEINSIKQERIKSVSQVHEAAAKNRAEAVQMIEAVLENEYL